MTPSGGGGGGGGGAHHSGYGPPSSYHPQHQHHPSHAPSHHGHHGPHGHHDQHSPQGQHGFGHSSQASSYYGGPPNNSESDVFLASKVYMGRIIGQKGVTINDLQKRSGCDIQINQDVPHGQDCEITIKGPRSGIENVKQMLCEIIEMGPNHPYAGGGGQYQSGGGHGGGYQQQTHGGYQQQPVQQPFGYHHQPTQSYEQSPHQHHFSHHSQQQYAAPHPQQQQHQQAYGVPYQQAPANQTQAFGGPPTYGQPSMMPPQVSSWKSATAADGQIYYYNEKTGETQWDKPVGMP
eukprot:CAMPEP_0116848680 /NCGR_PEP_ID=MMETSP0418-20121206/15142_1 /TAXON_ID=1158023 /ORGANISM="Astrosyne radiata, Strain 13vi08-1A" /LENGTH=291 /DNA_ID=CAMNT_0004480299 /DNA_START=10 /DNA_END=885 /DNA_ORIENTATION=+